MKKSMNPPIAQTFQTFMSNRTITLFFTCQTSVGYSLYCSINRQKKPYNIRDEELFTLGNHLLFAEFALDNQFVAAVPAFQLLAFRPNVPDVELRNEIKEGLSDEDNPVLLFYTLKDPDVE